MALPPPGSPAASRLPLWIALVACAAAAFWTAQGVAPWDGEQKSAWHHYEYLAEGFAHGHTYLSVNPEPGLLALKDPYDPATNFAYRFWDATYFQGRYYLYFGPTPAVFMAAARVVTGHMPPQRLMVAAFAAAGLAGLALLLSGLWRAHFPGVSPLAVAAILIVGFFASWLPVVLRRSAVWELPIVAAVACLWWALACLWRFHESGGAARWAVGAGVAVALLLGSRITCIFAGAIVTLLFLAPSGAAVPGRRRRWTGFAIVAALASAGGIALLVYNHERFGRWLEFGDTYQLRGADERKVLHFSPGYFLFNARAYLLSIPRFGVYFPFLHPFWSDAPPPGYIAYEDLFGVLFMMPAHLAGLAALAWAWRRRSDPAGGAARLVVGAAAGASVFAALILFSFAGACSRYIAELVAGSTVLAATGFLALLGSEEGRRLGRSIPGCAAVVGAWTVVCVCLASADFRGFMKETNPRTFHAVAHALDYPAYWWAKHQGVYFGPLGMEIAMPPAPGGRETILVASGRPQLVNHLILTQGPGDCALSFVENQHVILASPAFRPAHDPLPVRIDAPWLYPPSESPYWDAIADPEVRLRHQTLYSIKWDGGAVAILSPHVGDPIELEPVVRRAADSAPDTPAVVAIGPAPDGT